MREKDIENLVAQYPDDFFSKEQLKLISQQYVVEGKRFDILFEDKHHRKVIVEIKLGILSREASGQIVEYYGLLKSKFPDDLIELVLIANVIPSERRIFLERMGIDCVELSLTKLLEVADKHNYIIPEIKLKSEICLRAVDQGENLGIKKETSVWIYQANPKLYDVLNALSDEKLTTIHWQVNQHKNEIKKGSIGIIWMSGCDSGIYAITRIITDPYIAEESPEDSRYWIDETKKMEGARLRVKMEIEIRLSNRPLFRSELKEVSGLENLSILKQPQGTNFPVTDEEWKIISSLMKQQID